MNVHERCLTASLVLVASLILLVPGRTLAEEPNKEFVAGELLVKFKKGYDGPGAEAIEKLGAKVLEKLSRIDVSRLKLPGGMTVDKAIAKLEKLPFIEYAEPNLIFKPVWAPNDPDWNKQWGMTAIDVPAAWSTETGDASTIIAIVDTGVDLDHPDLKHRIVPGYDFVDMDDDPDDVGGHGTHCAGIAAASANNGKGVAGVCPNCSIMPVRVLNEWGGSASDVAKGMIWAADHGAQVISMSLGGTWPSSAQEDAIEYAWQKGAILIAAAGNMGTDTPHYPAYHDTCVAVGSTDDGGGRSSFSNYGSWVDVAAPGGFIYSSVPGGGYEYKSGTSMACPHVAGLAGLLFSRAGATNVSVRQAIESNTDPVGSWVAHGLVNAAKALKSTPPKPPKDDGDKKPKDGGDKKPKDGGDKKPKDGGGETDPAGGFAPTGAWLGKGKALEAPANSLVSSDGVMLVMRSTETGKKRELSLVVKSKISYKGSLEKLKIVFEARLYDNPGEIAAYLYNWSTKSWDWVGKGSLGADTTRVELVRKSPQAYVSGSGEVQLKIYRQSDWWTTFDMGADYTRFVPTAKKGGSASPPPDQSEPPPKQEPPPDDEGDDPSLEGKAKDAWNKLKKKW